MQGKRILLNLLLVTLVIACLTVSCFAAPKKVELSLWGGYPEMAPFYKQVAADYQKANPGVKITFLTNPLREHEQKISAAIPSDTAADLIEISAYSIRKFIDAGMIPANPANVDKFVRSESFEKFYQKVLTVNKKTYGIPFFQGRQVLFWNKKMFEEAGLSRAPQTWEEVISYSKKLAKYDANGDLTRAGISLRKSGGGSGVAEKFWFWLYPAGGDIVKEVSPGKYCNGYDNAAGRATLQLYIDLLYKYKVDSFKVKADAEGFGLESHAMFTRESWVVGFMQKSAPNLEFDAALLPRNNRGGTICSLVNFYVTKNSKNPKEAWKFAMFMMKPEYQKFLLSKVGWFPCRTDVDYEPIYKKTPQYRAFMELPKGYKLYTVPPIACFDEIETKMAEKLCAAFLDESLVNNPKKIAQVMHTAAMETDQILKENGIYAGR
jgi:multiple sugar transport system substrate-binding protein